MNDDLEDLEPTGPQKSVTDWLMKVISGKEPVEEGTNGASHEAVLPPLVNGFPAPELPQKSNGSGTDPLAALFTATDLCGSPAIPIVPFEEETTPAEEITADDVCWVPEERRLKPQPAMQAAVESPGISSNGHAPNAADIVVNAADFMREPAPFIVQKAAVREPESREITAVDISKQWVIDEMETASVAAEQERIAAAELIAGPVMRAEPQAEAAAIPVAPELDAVAEPVVMEAEPEVARTADADVSEPTVIEAKVAESTVEPDLTAAEVFGIHEVAQDPAPPKSWAQEGYWETEIPKVQPAEDLPVEAQLEIPRETKRPAGGGGYFGSVLEPEEIAEIERAKPEGWSSAWRTLIRLGSALPWLSRTLPSLEAGAENSQNSGAAASATGATADMSEDVAGLRLVQYEIRTTVQDHSAQLKRMEDQLSRVREAVDSKASEDSELMSSVNAAMRKLRLVGIGLASLLIVLIVLALIAVLRK